jgi:hypothetical protein|tara:strand:- start:217 stop:402 length:186 start_codon:yes stop_codon:yes gene_type:complete
MPYYWKAYNTILAEFESEEDAKDALDFNRTMLVSLPNGEEFNVTKDDIIIVHEEKPVIIDG